MSRNLSVIVFLFVSVAAGTDVIFISAGAGHSLAVRTDGTVWAWGMNSSGQLGTGDTVERHIPTKVVGPGGAGFLDGVVAVGAGYRFSVALKSDGTVWAWGDNSYGQLGTGTTEPSTVPVQVRDTSGTGFLHDVVAISVGCLHCLALLSDGTLLAWGSNRQGCLGIGTSDYSPHPLPVRVKDSTGTDFLRGVRDLCAGSAFSLAVVDDSTEDIYGIVYSWGANNSGQLGNDTVTSRYLPAPVLSPDGLGFLSGAVSVSATPNGVLFTNGHSLAVMSDSTLMSWGRNTNGQLGDGTTTNRYRPVAVLDSGGTGVLTGVVKVCAGMEHTVALLCDGTVWTWGENIYGELGTGPGPGRTTPGQVLGQDGIGTLEGIVDVSSSHCHNLALDADGRVWAWGRNDHGQLGDGTVVDRSFPVQVPFEPLEVASQKPKAHKLRLSVHPNPFNAACLIKLDGAAGESTISIFDAAGRLVVQRMVTGAGFLWRPEGIPSGVYLLRASDGKRTESRLLLLVR